MSNDAHPSDDIEQPDVNELPEIPPEPWYHLSLLQKLVLVNFFVSVFFVLFMVWTITHPECASCQ